MRAALSFVLGALSVPAGVALYHWVSGHEGPPPVAPAAVAPARESAATLEAPPDERRLERLETEVAALRRALERPPPVLAPKDVQAVDAATSLPLAATEAEAKSYESLSTEQLINDARILAEGRKDPEGVFARWKVILRRATAPAARYEALMQLGHAGRFLRGPAGNDLAERAYRDAAMEAGPATDGAREANTNLVEILLYKKDGQGARDLADTLLSDQALSRWARPRVRFSHAQSLEALGYTSGARTEYESLAKEYPEGDNLGWVGKAAAERLTALR